MKDKKILLSNDDGYFAQGIKTLRSALQERWDVVVVAPDMEKSACSHSLTLHHPLRADLVEEDVWRVDGTPTDCVLLAMRADFGGPAPDMVVSGINAGPNLGDDVTYSGTVAAAIEGTLLGYPSVAISLCGTTHFDTAASIGVDIVAKLASLQLPPNTLLNINVPDLPRDRLKGMRITHQGKRTYSEHVISRHDPRGELYYWIAGDGPFWEEDEGSDFEAVNDGFVSITPLHLDLTNYRAMKDMDEWTI